MTLPLILKKWIQIRKRTDASRLIFLPWHFLTFYRIQHIELLKNCRRLKSQAALFYAEDKACSPIRKLLKKQWRLCGKIKYGSTSFFISNEFFLNLFFYSADRPLFLTPRIYILCAITFRWFEFFIFYSIYNWSIIFYYLFDGIMKPHQEASSWQIHAR